MFGNIKQHFFYIYHLKKFSDKYKLLINPGNKMYDIGLI